FGNGSSGKLQLNGFDITIASLSSGAPLGNPIIEDNASSGTHTLTINSGASTTYAGVLQNGGISSTLALTKSGLGVLTLTGTNTYSGKTTLSAGTLNINSASAIGTGTLDING